MRFLFFSDLHCHNWSQHRTRLPNGLNSRLNDCLDIIRQAATAVKQHQVDHVFFLGDLFESRTSLDIDVVTETYKAIRDLAETVPQKVWLLVGNHDQMTKIGDVHSIEVFRDISDVVVLDEPKNLTIDDVRVAAFPHNPCGQDLKKGFSQIEDVDLVLIHQPLREGTIGPYAKTISAELSVKDLPLDSCRYVLAGDYHKRQFVSGTDNRVHYIGSPLQLKSDEVGEEKGFTLLDTDGWNLYTIETDYPRFRIFDTPGDAADAINAGKSSVDTGRDFIRIRYTKKTQHQAEELKEAFERVQIDEDVVQDAMTRTSADITESDLALCQEYIDHRGDVEVPDEDLLSAAMGLLEGE